MVKTAVYVPYSYMCHLALSVVYLALTVEYICHILTLTVVYMPYYGLDCRICAIFRCVAGGKGSYKLRYYKIDEMVKTAKAASGDGSGDGTAPEAGTFLNLRTTTSQKGAAVPRRARI